MPCCTLSLPEAVTPIHPEAAEGAGYQLGFALWMKALYPTDPEGTDMTLQVASRDGSLESLKSPVEWKVGGVFDGCEVGCLVG